MTAQITARRAAMLAVSAAAMLAATLGAEAGSPKSAQIAEPRVMVPQVPIPGPGGGLAGCWSADRLIYGPYAFSFCSNGSYGSYKVRGGGLYCNGGVSVSRGYGTVTVRLSRSRCNSRTDWSADYLVCRTGGRYWYRDGHNSRSTRAPQVAVPHVAVPHVPVPGGRLDCTYYPAASGYHPIGLGLRRS